MESPQDSKSNFLLNFAVVSNAIQLPFRIAAVNHITELNSNIPTLLAELEASLKRAVTMDEVVEACNSVCGKANGCLDALSQLWSNFLGSKSVLDWFKPEKKQVGLPQDFIKNLTEITGHAIQEGVAKLKSQLQDAVDQQVSNFMLFSLLDSCVTTTRLAFKLYEYYISAPKQIEYIKKEFASIRYHLVDSCLLLASYFSQPFITETKIMNHLKRAETLIFNVETIVNSKLESLEEERTEMGLLTATSAFNFLAIGKTLYSTYETIRNPTRVLSFISGGVNAVNMIGGSLALYQNGKLIDQYNELKKQNDQYKIAHCKIKQAFEETCKRQNNKDEEIVEKMMKEGNITKETAQNILLLTRKMEHK